MGVMAVLADRRGSLIGSSFVVIDVGPRGSASATFSDLARNWHDEDDDDGS
jgi:hypothetical protein